MADLMVYKMVVKMAVLKVELMAAPMVVKMAVK